MTGYQAFAMVWPLIVTAIVIGAAFLANRLDRPARKKPAKPATVIQATATANIIAIEAAIETVRKAVITAQDNLDKVKETTSAHNH